MIHRRMTRLCLPGLLALCLLAPGPLAAAMPQAPPQGLRPETMARYAVQVIKTRGPRNGNHERSIVSGTVVSSQGHVLTCAHFLDDWQDGDQLWVIRFIKQIENGREVVYDKEDIATFVAKDPKADLGLLKIEPDRRLTWAILAPPNYQLRPGDTLIRTASIEGQRPKESQHRVTRINGHQGAANFYTDGFIGTTAQQNMGNSGSGFYAGPYFLVGVGWGADPQQREVYCSAIDEVHKFLAANSVALRPTLINIKAEWCGPCKQYHEDHTRNADFQKYLLANFVSREVDADTYAEFGRGCGAQKGIPTFRVNTSDYVITGYRGLPWLREQLDCARPKYPSPPLVPARDPRMSEPARPFTDEAPAPEPPDEKEVAPPPPKLEEPQPEPPKKLDEIQTLNVQHFNTTIENHFNAIQKVIQENKATVDLTGVEKGLADFKSELAAAVAAMRECCGQIQQGKCQYEPGKAAEAQTALLGVLEQINGKLDRLGDGPSAVQWQEILSLLRELKEKANTPPPTTPDPTHPPVLGPTPGEQQPLYPEQIDSQISHFVVVCDPQDVQADRLLGFVAEAKKSHPFVAVVDKQAVPFKISTLPQMVTYGLDQKVVAIDRGAGEVEAALQAVARKMWSQK